MLNRLYSASPADAGSRAQPGGELAMENSGVGLSRRGLLRSVAAGSVGSAAAPALALAAQPGAPQDPSSGDAAQQAQLALKSAVGTKLVILGSGGGPGLARTRHMASHVMLSNGSAYVLDCGLGVTDQFARTGIHFSALRSIFITHHHPDHNIEYGPLLVIGWLQGMPTSVRAFGPPPLRLMTEDLLRAHRPTIDFWRDDHPSLPALAALDVQEVSAAGAFTKDENVEVTAAIVHHPPVKPALGYRFDFRDRSIAFSGDTTPVEAVARLAKGADVLVHEAMLVSEIAADIRRQLADGRPGSFDELLAHTNASHSPIEAVGRIAQEAGVKTLVLSHLIPSIDTITDDEWRAPAARTFKGEIIVARDLMVI
jgi:ribonuclease BN (tRNA processing enzyme)